eukprot:1197479-Prymnesium_polylepis.1
MRHPLEPQGAPSGVADADAAVERRRRRAHIPGALPRGRQRLLRRVGRLALCARVRLRNVAFSGGVREH